MEIENFIQCVGELPWAGFIIGCILSAIAIVVLTYKLWGVIKYKLSWYTWWCTRKEAKIKARPEEYWDKKEARKYHRSRIADTVGVVIAWIFVGTFGLWMIWGFVKVLFCYFTT